MSHFSTVSSSLTCNMESVQFDPSQRSLSPSASVPPSHTFHLFCSLTFKHSLTWLYMFCISHLCYFCLSLARFSLFLSSAFSYFLHKLPFLPSGPHSSSISPGFAPRYSSSSSAAASELSRAHLPQEQPQKKRRKKRQSTILMSGGPWGFITS